MSREDGVFERPVVFDGINYARVPKGLGATKYIVGDEDLLWLVRQAKKVQAIQDYLEHGKSAAVIWEFLNQDKPLPIPSTRKRTKEGRMAFERAWDEMQGPPKESRVNEILKERFNGAPGWEE